MNKLEVILTGGGATLLRLELPTLLDANQVLETVNRLISEARPLAPTLALSIVSKKYRTLAEHLANSPQRLLKLSFGEIERLLGTPLPPSARTQRAWWANTDSHSQASAWMAAGWLMGSVDLRAETVEFRKEA